MNTIWITFQCEGLHRYPAAADDPNLSDVSYLAHPHRHVFHFKVWIQVWHDDRDIEFIIFKNWCKGLYLDGVLDFNYKSCEMLADDLAAKIKNKYPARYCRISVAEDNENGCEFEYPVEEQ